MNAEAAILEELRALRATVEKLDAKLSAQPANEVEHYVGIEAVQAQHQVSRSTVHNWVAEGCPCERRGRVVRFKLSEVDAWFKGRAPMRRVK